MQVLPCMHGQAARGHTVVVAMGRPLPLCTHAIVLVSLWHEAPILTANVLVAAHVNASCSKERTSENGRETEREIERKRDIFYKEKE